MNRSARPLVESALLAALGAVFILISFYVPILGLFATLVSPLPAAFVVIRHGVRWGFLSSIVTLFVLVPFVSPFTAIGLWAVYGAMGIALGYSVRRRLPPARAIGLMAAASMAGTIVDYAAAYLATGLTIGRLIDEVIRAFQFALEANRKILGPNPMLDQMAETMTRELLLRVLPASFVLAAFIVAWLNYEVMRRILPRFGYSMDPLRPFSRWIMPEAFGHAWIVAIIALQLQPFYAERFPVLLVVVENLLMVASIVMTMNGASSLSFYLRKAGLSRPLLGLFVFLAFSMVMSSPYLAMGAQLFGMIDVLFDLRRLRYPELEGT